LRAPTARPPLRILLADDRLGYERSGLHGGGRLVLAWTRALVERGLDVTTVILRGGPRFHEMVEAQQLPIVILDRTEFDPRTYLDFLSIIDDRATQLLHLQGHGAAAFGRLAALRRRLPTVVHTHADYRVSPKGYPWYVRAADRLLAPAADLALAVSRQTRRFAIEERGFRPDQVEIFPNAVDVAAFHRPRPDERAAARRELGIPDGGLAAITVGRLDRLKGVDLQVEVWGEVLRAQPAAALLVVGDGPERAALERHAADHGLQRSLHFLGWRSDVERLLGAADFAVLSSRDEGLPLVVLEAMACGLPVLATEVGGVPEVVRDGVNGLLVPPDDRAALARGFAALFADAALRERLAAGAARTVAGYSLSLVAARLEAVYRRVLAAHAESAGAAITADPHAVARVAR
jgi:glycosyltransferase involved in cell wall biosynthesis